MRIGLGKRAGARTGQEGTQHEAAGAAPLELAAASVATAAEASGPSDGKLRARFKIGIDANRPVHPKTGEIQAQVADPDVIASTGAGWVRLNFILRPWDHPHDETLHDGRTWAETYRQLISGFREKGLKVYGLIGCEAMPKIPKDQFRSPPPRGKVVQGWTEQ